jgi:hypothetical protein
MLRDLLRVGFQLLGAWMVAYTLVGVADVIGGLLPILTSPSEVSRSELIKSAGLAMSFSVGWALVFGALPGWMLFSRARGLANWLEPSGRRDSNSVFSVSALLPIGAILLGASLVVDGAAGLVAGTVTTVVASLFHDGVGRELSIQNALSALLHSGVLLAAGLAFGFWGVRTAKSAGNEYRVAATD